MCLAVLNEQLHGSDANDRASRCILNEVSPANMRSNGPTSDELIYRIRSYLES